MPPADKSPEQQLRYFIRLLAAVCQMSPKGELRIPTCLIRKLEDDPRQAIFEDTDTEKDEIVLRFGSKHSAMYPVEPITRGDQPSPTLTPSQPTVPLTVPPLVSTPIAQPSRHPLTMEQLARAEQKIKQVRLAAQLKQARQMESERELSEILERAKQP